MERKLREAPPEMAKRVGSAVNVVLRCNGSEHWADSDLQVRIAVEVEAIMGPFDKKQVGDFGVRFTKLQAEPDGYHEYVTLYFT